MPPKTPAANASRYVTTCLQCDAQHKVKVRQRTGLIEVWAIHDRFAGLRQGSQLCNTCPTWDACGEWRRLHERKPSHRRMVTRKANPGQPPPDVFVIQLGRDTKRMEAKKKPAKNDKAERNINDIAVDLMVAERTCPICKRPLWKEKYDAVVKGHLWVDLKMQIAPGGDHPPGVLYFSRGCASGLFRLLTATPLSSCRPRKSRGLLFHGVLPC